MYQPGDGYMGERWTSFYKSLTQYRVLESTYADLDEAGRSDNEIFLLASRVFIYSQLHQIIDMFGDVPFSEAGYLPLTGDITTSYPSYERAESLYKLMLDDLQSINVRLGELEGRLGTLATSYFSAQDYINNGNVLKWRKFANSLRLRLALRVSSYGSLTSEGRGIINEMLSNPSSYPVVDSNAETICIVADGDGFNPLRDESGSEGIKTAFEGDVSAATGVTNRAPKPMIDRMVGDPRLPVMFSPNAEGSYIGLDPLDRADFQMQGLERSPNLYASMDSATYNRNDAFPGLFFTAAELSFIRSESYHLGYASGDARSAFELAVTQSIDYYFDLNASSSWSTPEPRPSAEEIAAFASSKWEGDPALAIATQKWIHFGCLHTLEAWSDLRRTGLPALEYLTDNTSVDCKTPIDRIRYPSDERNNNESNYRTVQSQDTYYTKLFWAKP
jgi:hypothetical protein